ncbi:hypothetical protein T484DRAFT_1833017 [Baffinella frigidus]|nr:hypothetical protein T484DRAFT_1833017 [Cryptophyta sp. CCMP2293]
MPVVLTTCRGRSDLGQARQLHLRETAMSMEGLRGSFLDVKRSSVVEGISNEALATFLASGALAIGAVWLSLDRNRRAAPGASGAAGGDVANDPPPSETLPAPSPASAPPLSGNYWSSTAEIPTCPICLESVQWACETSCGHAFCAACFLTWSQRFAMRTVTCPMDRRQVHAVYASAALRRRHQRAPGHVPPSPSEVTRHAELDEQLLRFNERNGAGWVHENARWPPEP